MVDSFLIKALLVRRSVVYGALMWVSVALTAALPLVAACLALVFLSLMALETPARAVLGLGLVALGSVHAVSLVAGHEAPSGLPVLAAGLVPAILLAPRSTLSSVASGLRAPGALAEQLDVAAEKLELLRGSDLDSHQTRCLDDAIACCESVRHAVDLEDGLRRRAKID